MFIKLGVCQLYVLVSSVKYKKKIKIWLEDLNPEGADRDLKETRTQLKKLKSFNKLATSLATCRENTNIHMQDHYSMMLPVNIDFDI